MGLVTIQAYTMYDDILVDGTESSTTPPPTTPTGPYYVATTGSDTNPGTIDQPFKTIPKAVSVAAAGDTIYLRGGVHNYSTTIALSSSGQAGKPISIVNYNNENVILDFSAQSYSSTSRGINISGSYWYIKGITVRYAGDNGIYITGTYNKIENSIFHDNKDTGLQISNGGSYNEVINCDSYRNYDPASNGENADGFAAKLGIGPGNKFIGNRAWDNSDDGWDCYESGEQIIFDNNWAFNNGINIFNDPNFQGDGNGIKLGGNYVAGPHIVRNNVAFGNPSKGFDQNHNMGALTLYNNTAWDNGRNFVIYEAPTSGQHILKNNIAFATARTTTNVQTESTSIIEANSWQGFTVTDADFISLDATLAKAARNADGSLPVNSLFRLASGSDMINAGVNVGIQYNGTAPDLGAFESTY